MEFKELRAELQRNGETIQKLLDGVTPVQARRKPAPDAWSMLEVICHLYDEEREDFRQRLASLYDHWRQSLAADWEKTPQRERPEARGVSPRVLASFVQALLHGLTTQLAADPEAFDREEMLEFCFRMLAPFFAPTAPKARKRNGGHPSRPEGESHA